MINAQNFVRAYMQGDTIQDVANKLAMTPAQVYARAYNLRRRGVNLPKKHQTNRGVDIEKLNQLIANMTKDK